MYPDASAPGRRTQDDIQRCLAPTLSLPPDTLGGLSARATRRLPIVSLSIAVVAILAGSALFLSGYALGRQTASQPGTPANEGAAFQPFWDTYHTITDRYAGGPVDRDALIQGAIRGMIGALGDPYSAYLSAEGYRQSLQGISGKFEGIGAEIGTEAPDGTQGCTPLGVTCRLVVTKPLADSPAERAGLKTGDRIIAIDGAPLDGLTVDAALGRIRGPKDSVVTLTIQRGSAAPIQIAITRDVIQTKEVDSEALAGGTVGYVRLAGFSDAAADDLVTALRAHLAAGRTKLILDLRGNPGGYVTAARKIASQFVGSGVVFWEQDAQGDQVPTNALGDGVATDPAIRVVVLIDGGTASASEIVAGRAPGQQAGDARRPAVVREGDRPGVAAADRRGWGVQADHRPLADARQALDPREGPHAGRRRHAAGPDPDRHRPRSPEGARGARGGGVRVGAAGGGLRHHRLARRLALGSRIGYGFRERKEVMCSDRQ